VTRHAANQTPDPSGAAGAAASGADGAAASDRTGPAARDEAGVVRYVAILSDLDGVLIDSGEVVEQTWRVWSERNGLDPDAVLPIVHGRPGHELVAELTPHLDVDEEMVWLEEFEIAAANRVRAFDGATEVLAYRPVAIVTSCTEPLARARLGANGLPIPDVLVTADRVPRGKPAPDPYLIAARELGVDPARCAVLEDAPAGIAAGKAAGATVFAIATTHDPAELTQADSIHADLPAALRYMIPISELSPTMKR
jgi:mannitol-1-/sugar-/sorbitol-6-phosphatase